MKYLFKFVNTCLEQYLTALYKQEMFVVRSSKVGKIFNMSGERKVSP